MDDQPKEGGEGDKKIVHVYPLVKVSPTDCEALFMFNFTRQFSNYLSCDKAKAKTKDAREGRTRIDGLHV